MWPGWIYWTDLMTLFELDFRNRFDYCRFCRHESQAPEARHTTAKCTSAICMACRRPGHIARLCPSAAASQPGTNPGSNTQAEAPGRNAQALSSEERAFPGGMPSFQNDGDTDMGGSVTDETPMVQRVQDEGEESQAAAQEREMSDSERMPPPTHTSIRGSRRRESGSCTGLFQQRIPNPFLGVLRWIQEGCPTSPHGTLSASHTLLDKAPLTDGAPLRDPQRALQRAPAPQCHKTVPELAQARQATVFALNSIEYDDPGAVEEALREAAQPRVQTQTNSAQQREVEAPRIVSSSSRMPTTVTWNVQTISPAAMTQIKEHTKQLGVKVWLLQEWRTLNRTFDKKADIFDVPEPWRAFSGRATAVIITDPEWKVEKIAHSFHSSLVTVCLPSGVGWSFLSMYLPSNRTVRDSVLLDPVTFSHDTFIDQCVARHVIGGDFNLHYGPDDVEMGWTKLTRCMAPKVEVYSMLHPLSETGRRISHRGKAHRIDHFFTTMEVMEQVETAKILSPAGASDHHLIVILGTATVPSSVDNRAWKDWLAEIARIRAHLFNWQFVQSIKHLPKRKELAAMQDRLDNFDISNPEEAQKHAELTSQLQVARLAVFPEESLDIFQIQQDLPTWPADDSQGAPDQVPLLATKVVEFYHKLGKAPGLAGIPPAAFKCSTSEFHEFTARVFNYLSDHDCNTNSVILGHLLFKAKQGNVQTEVAHYCPISVSDVDRHLLHSMLAARIVAQVDQIIPQEQTGFIPGRSISSNISVMTLIAEAATRGWLKDPIVILEQDQAKAYDRVEHHWRDRVLEDLGMPERVTRLLRNLYAGVNICFDLGELTKAVVYKRGFLQGAPDSPLWYMLTYQPFLNKYESSGAGVTVKFRGQQVHISYVAYADNSFFLCSAEDAKAYWAARKQYDITSGSQLNAKESSVTVLKPLHDNGPLPSWIEEFKEHFTV
ncbi:hypothetical protein [Sporisorium scitamineum]|uniref:CCHC-type domain-containing protein n=1 Tax=Sporisorium scitamineum TaxID=49012 RepID=A0A0F7RXJ2_9BASI|nr:hypothetical protein [Sporisorium scitamineum]